MKKEEILAMGFREYMDRANENINCHNCIDCIDCLWGVDLTRCAKCHNCINCVDCVNCRGVSDRRYVVDNIQLTESEYKDFMAR